MSWDKKRWGDRYNPNKTSPLETDEDMKELGEINKIADCIDIVRKRIEKSGIDATGFSNWCPSEAKFIMEVMKEYNKKIMEIL